MLSHCCACLRRLAMAVGALPGGPAPLRLAALHRRPDRSPASGRYRRSRWRWCARRAAGPRTSGSSGRWGHGVAARPGAHPTRPRRERRHGRARRRARPDHRGGAVRAHPLLRCAVWRQRGPTRTVLRPAAAAAELGPVCGGAHRRGCSAAGDRARPAARRRRLDARRTARHPAGGAPPAVHAGLRWRLAYTGQVGAALAGPRATAAVLTGLPALGILLGELVGAGPLQSCGRECWGSCSSCAGAVRGRGRVGAGHHALGGAAMTSKPLAVLVLAAALLTFHGEPGSGRLHDLFAGTVDTLGGAGVSQARRGVETVGPVHQVAGGVGLGLLVWALTGAVPAGVLAAGIGLGFRWPFAGSPHGLRAPTIPSSWPRRGPSLRSARSRAAGGRRCRRSGRTARRHHRQHPAAGRRPARTG